MSMVVIVEAVFDALAAMGLKQEHECFDDLVSICSNVAAGRSRCADDAMARVKVIPDETVRAAWDIVSYIKSCGGGLSPAAVIANAIAAGKKARGRECDG